MSALEGRDLVVEVINRLHAELQSRAEWENDTLPCFLEAFSALLGSIENAHTNTGQPVPNDPWVLVAAALEGARSYE